MNERIEGKKAFIKLPPREEKRLLLSWLDENFNEKWISQDKARKTGNPNDLPENDLKEYKSWKLTNGYE